MSYQDVWSKGQVRHAGYRQCAERFDLVAAWCRDTFRNGEPFTVADIGANHCYFGLRLVERFKRCHVIAIEGNYSVLRAARVLVRGVPRVALMGHHVSQASLKTLAHVIRVDVVLCFSILHHIPGDAERILDSLRRMGRHVLIEYASTDSARVAEPPRPPAMATLLGYGSSHLKNGCLRPIYHVEGHNERA